MGLDLAFSRTLALAAGAKLSTERYGTDEEITAAESEINKDEFYIKHLKSTNEYFNFPNYPNTLLNSGTDDSIIIRANKWGSTYAPLTAWLTKNNITWSEF